MLESEPGPRGGSRPVEPPADVWAADETVGVDRVISAGVIKRLAKFADVSQDKLFESFAQGMEA